MSRENGEQEQYLDLRYINEPLSHHPAVFNLNPAINGVANNTEGRTIELSCDSQGSDTKSYSYVMGSVQFTNDSSSHQEAFLQPEKSQLNTASYYNQPIQTLGTMQNMDAVEQGVSCSSLSVPGYYPPAYLATGYYPDPYRMPQDQTANSYLMESTVISKDAIRLSPIKFCSNCFTTETPSWRRCSEGKNLLCNACGLYEKLHHTPRKICLHPDGSTKIVRHNTSENEGCAICGTTYSSLWRKLDKKCYCNACAVRLGIGHAKRMSLPQIWSDTGTGERDNVGPDPNPSGLLFSSLAATGFPHSQHDV
ncbi:hypothetical protein K450DRAFT_288191 [Umbelopsis ramanniana AG]|uniref:GATA-type domain-containing protein n=1 Tax=Umbelopsis ramanniana AG TaxID=1314678 RepID=A0AAD5EIP4_UMBRA|nr:uncharacterized protein K450DRAFT_288191 [Umbelopsis ramanniana AG]KAI8583775.1 hypothetical protein K450DRAFT_288191 [Umbelopsis ramanniana AG]